MVTAEVGLRENPIVLTIGEADSEGRFNLVAKERERKTEGFQIVIG
ncbi:MAG: hypothetical protein WB586_20295 [Chthoniobacterales bacterium]